VDYKEKHGEYLGSLKGSSSTKMLYSIILVSSLEMLFTLVYGYKVAWLDETKLHRFIRIQRDLSIMVLKYCYKIKPLQPNTSK
jgi:hypothetical protein